MNRDYTDRTIQTARWAREQIKRQTGRFTLFSEPPLQKPPYGGNARNWVGTGPWYPPSGPASGSGSDSARSWGDENLYE